MAAELPEEPPRYLGLLDNFLHDVVILVRAVAAGPALPPKTNYLSTRQHPTFLVARPAVAIAHELAKQHAPAAIHGLRRLSANRDAFVDHMHRAMWPL